MRTIEEVFSEKPQSTLYHYTSIGSLMDIVESKVLWASHIYYLNDSAEIVFASRLLKNLVDKRISKALLREEKEFLEQFHSWLETFITTPYHIFVFSLSEKGNLLSQWRSYTPHEKGVSIAFTPNFLTRKVQDQNLRIAKCLYERDEQETLMSELLNRMLITSSREKEEIKTSSFHVYMDKFRSDILKVFALIKDPAFKEECEWRIISQYYPKYTVPEIKFREGASMLVPYIEIKIGNKGTSELLFEQIIIGPTQHNNLSMSALSSYLSNKKVCSATASSAIPYREW